MLVENIAGTTAYLKDRTTFCIAGALVDAYMGDWERGLFFCGSNVSRCTKIERASEIFDELVGSDA
jgi:nitronate monooxygenase